MVVGFSDLKENEKIYSLTFLFVYFLMFPGSKPESHTYRFCSFIGPPISYHLNATLKS